MAIKREQILNARRRVVSVPIPEWGGDLLLQELSAAEMGEVLKQRKSGDENDRMFRAAIVVACAVDEDGKHFLTDEDIPTLVNGLWVPLREASNAAYQLHALRKTDVRAVQANFTATPGVDSDSV